MTKDAAVDSLPVLVPVIYAHSGDNVRPNPIPSVETNHNKVEPAHGFCA